MLPTLQILSNHYKRFAMGYPWVYANELTLSQETKELPPGQLVTLLYQNNPLAIGYFNRHSLIAFRALTRTPNQIINTDFFIKRLREALALRTACYSKPFYRLVHAEADILPGLIVDRFDDVFVLQINTHGMENLKPYLLEAMQTVFNPSTLYLKNDSPVRSLEGLSLDPPTIIGNPLDQLKIEENNIQFLINMNSSQKTGWFFDHRENRQMIAKLAKGKTVIDYFCYSGGFSLQAAKFNAKQVIGVDRSETALQNARTSANLNQLSQQCEFVCSDVFKDMDERIANNQTFDIVILDPPAFVKSKKDLASGLKGYEKLLNKALSLVANNGFLLIASCSYHVKENDLKHCLAKALSKKPREAKIIGSLSAGPDHPTHPLLEESSYLKGLLVFLN